jgi:hypothetical protein
LTLVYFEEDRAGSAALSGADAQSAGKNALTASIAVIIPTAL